MILRKASWKSTSVSSCFNYVVNFQGRSFSSEEYNYLQRSSTPTLHFQKSLPRLPIPDLSKTCQRYLRAQKPLLSSEEFAKVELLVKNFEAGFGAELQKQLKWKDSKNKHTSYISKPWFDMYLKDRTPIPINYNPFLVFIDDPKPEYNDQLIRATNLLISSLRFMKSLRANILEPEVFHLNPRKSDTKLFRKVTGALPSAISWYGAYLFKAFPLDMSQYENLFNTARIPEIGKDHLYHDPNTRHIVVLKDGNFYSMDVLDESGVIIDHQTLFSCLKYILSQDKESSSFPVGILTTLNRDEWAVARKHLLTAGNGEALKLIDSSLFVLALDREVSVDNKALIQQYLHSDGTNRWFDKSFSLIVSKSGAAGLNFEHSWGDGVAVLRYFQDIYKDSSENPFIHPTTKENNSKTENLVSTIEFKLDDKSREFISEARTKYKAKCDSLNIELFEFQNFGRNLCKIHAVSPDCVMQLAFQIAYDKLHKKQVATYESCSTAAFKHGRTETMRPCTIETTNVCKALRSDNRQNKEKLIEMIKKCSSTHGKLIKEAAMGQGFDRHLFALRILAEENLKVPDVFLDPSYAAINHNILSTSTLSSDVVKLGAFGPVVEDGYGIGYTIRNDMLGAIVTNYPSSSSTDFIKCLESALNEIYHILK